MVILPVLVIAATATSPPAIFWNSEGHVENTTVLALGGGLADATVDVCTDSLHAQCEKATVLQHWDGSVKFVLPSLHPATPTAKNWWFRACNAANACSSWRSINEPNVWWAQGDASDGSQATSTPGGWLRVFGRSIGFTRTSTGAAECLAASPGAGYPAFVTVTFKPSFAQTGGSTNLGVEFISSAASAASCYDVVVPIPLTAKLGVYTISISNELGIQALPGVDVLVTAAKAWPSTIFPVAVGDNVLKAAASAAKSGGGVLQLAPGSHLLHDVLLLGDGVQLTGGNGHGVGGAEPAVLLFASKMPSNTKPLISLANSTAAASHRFALRNLVVKVAVNVSTSSYVIGVGGHGVEIENVTVTMPTDSGKQLATVPSVLHTHGTGFSITGSSFTHAQVACESPGYPRDCLLFFDAGTDSGLVYNNTFTMGCCAFEGYSANGLVVDSNNFVDLPNAVQPDGNGFATFGGNRVSERISFSRNVYQGMFNGENVHDGTYPHEAFTSDGTGGAYAGPIASATHSSVTVPKAADKSYVGAVLAVLSGTGQGQSLRVTAAAGNTYTLAKPGLLVALDSTSIVVVVPYVGKVLVMGNNIRNSTTVQIFGSGFDIVYAGNILAHMYSDKVVHPGGLALMALNYAGYQPNMNFEVIQNKVHDVIGGLGVLIDGDPANMTLSHGHVVRDNVVTGKWVAPFNFSSFDGAITVGVDAAAIGTCGCKTSTGGCCFGAVKEAITDVVVEGNSVTLRPGKGDCEQNGVRVFAENTITRGNTCRLP